MKKYKLSLDESIPNSLQVNTVISCEAETLVGLLSKFLLAIVAMEEHTIDKLKSESYDLEDDDIPF